MAEELTIAIVVLVGLLIVIGLFLIFGNANTNLISSSSDSSNNINLNNQAKQADYALNSTVENNCLNMDSSICFKYQNPIQEKNNGIDTRPEQLKIEPCQELPKKCEVCFDSPEQTKGNGENYNPEQVRKNC